MSGDKEQERMAVVAVLPGKQELMDAVAIGAVWWPGVEVLALPKKFKGRTPGRSYRPDACHCQGGHSGDLRQKSWDCA